MAETLSWNEGSEIELIDFETFRSRLKELSEMGIDCLDSSDTPVSDTKFSEDWSTNFQGLLKQIELENPDVSKLGPQDLEAYLERLKKVVSLTADGNTKISSEIDILAKTVAEESAVLDGDLEKLVSSLKFIDFQGLHDIQANAKSISGEIHESPMHVSEDQKFEIWELDQQIEKSKFNLSNLQELNYVFRRIETIEHLEDILSEAKVNELEGNYIRLSLKTPIPISDGLLFRNKLDCVMEPCVLDHELLIEFNGSSLELKNAKVFPGDVYLDGFVDAVKSSRHLSAPMIGSPLGWLVRQVQYRILLCTLRCLLVKDANKSRHFFEYSDKDDMITAHLVGGIDAFIRVPQGWPISSSSLNLVSIRSSNVHSKSISLGFLCKVKELADSLDTQKRRHLAYFVDAIEEILIQAMHSELDSDDTPA